MQKLAEKTSAPASVASFEISVEDMTAERLKTIFKTEGAVIVRGLLGDARVGELRESLRGIISAQYRHATGHDPDPDADIDTLFNALCAIDRRLGALVYEAAREVPAFYGLLMHPWVQDVVKTVLDAEILQIPYDKAMFRIDRPNEPWFEFHWHQDYTYNLMSEPTVTVWTPLTSVTEDMGPLHVIPRSHGRLRRVRLESKRDAEGRPKKAMTAVLADIDPAELDARAVPVCLEPGDVLFFHHLLLHRSGKNRSNRARWSMVPRYGNMLDTDMVARGWTIERTPDFAALKALRPDAVVED